MTSAKAQSRLPNRLIDRARAALGPWGVFLRGFAKHPAMVSSVVPSSDRLINHMLSRVEWDKVDLFVEYGPGVGTFCRTVLGHMRGDATYIAIDTNADFIDFLSRDIADSRFHAVLGSAADVEAIIAAFGFDQADQILSGMPFANLPEDVGSAIVAATNRVLRPGGTFLVYLYRKRVLDFLTPHFSRIDRAYEWINVPPCHLFWAIKDGAPA